MSAGAMRALEDAPNDLPEGPVSAISSRELVVLACISLATVLVMCLAAELGTRWLWPESEYNSCFAQGQERPTPGCSTLIKNAEGPWTRMSYNECGYRSADSCGPKPADTRRLVILGSSIAAGWFIPYDQQFSTRVQAILKRQCGFPVQVLNMASIRVPVDQIGQLIPEAVARQPDAVLVPLAPYDLDAFAGSGLPNDDPRRVGRAARAAVLPTPQHLSPLTRLRLSLRDSRALLVAQHFLFQNVDFFVRAYLLGRSDDALNVPISGSFRTRYAHFEQVVQQWGDSLRRHDVPLVLVPVPNRIQAALLGRRERHPGVDPWAFRDQMRRLTREAGVGMVDVFPAFARVPHAERLYYPVDSHPDSDAHAIIAGAVARYALSGAVPAFASCHRLSAR